MTNILTISKNINLLNEISALLDEYQLQHCSFIYKNEDETINFIKENNFDIVLADSEIEEYTILLKKIKNIDLENNIFMLLLYDKDNFNNINNDSTGFIDAFIQKPVLKNILISTVNSYLKIKKNIDIIFILWYNLHYELNLLERWNYYACKLKNRRNIKYC